MKKIILCSVVALLAACNNTVHICIKWMLMLRFILMMMLLLI